MSRKVRIFDLDIRAIGYSGLPSVSWCWPTKSDAVIALKLRSL